MVEIKMFVTRIFELPWNDPAISSRYLKGSTYTYCCLLYEFTPIFALKLAKISKYCHVRVERRLHAAVADQLCNFTELAL
jgi:hypothetical protein